MIIQEYFLSFLYKNICCGYSLESPYQGDPNEYPQHVFDGEISKTIPYLSPTFNCSTDLYQSSGSSLLSFSTQICLKSSTSEWPPPVPCGSKPWEPRLRGASFGACPYSWNPSMFRKPWNGAQITPHQKNSTKVSMLSWPLCCFLVIIWLKLKCVKQISSETDKEVIGW